MDINTNSRLRAYGADIAVATTIGLLVLNSMSPIDMDFSRYLAQFALIILLATLAVGSIAFLLKRHGLMLFSFLSCIVLSSFLKQAQNQNFSYARPLQDIEIRVAHFTPQNAANRQELLMELPSLGANLISIQTPSDSNYEKQLERNLSSTHRFYKKMTYQDNTDILLFSTYPIQDLDTVYLDDMPSLAGSIWIDSIHGKIQFLSAYVTNLQQGQNVQDKLQKMSTYLEQHSQEKPLLTLGNMQLTGWSPEVRAFKQHTELNDSRIDIDWSSGNGHIFYSNHLQCLNFSSLMGGKGVMGVYQFCQPRKKDTQNSYTDTDTHTKITMF